MIPREPSEILKDNVSINDWMLLLNCVDTYIKVMRDNCNFDLVEKAEKLRKKL